MAVEGMFEIRIRLAIALIALMSTVACGEAEDDRSGDIERAAVPAEGAVSVLGIALGGSVDQGSAILQALTGSPLEMDRKNGRWAMPLSLDTDERPELFDHRVVDLAVMTSGEPERIEGIAALLGDFQSPHGDCDGELIEAVYTWAVEQTGDRQPRVEVSSVGALREELRRFDGDGVYVDTSVLHSPDWCMSLSFQVAEDGVPGPLDRREDFKAMTQRASAGDGFLAGHHGTYVPMCKAGDIDSARFREMEYTLWSEGELAYLNIGPFAAPGEAQLVARLGSIEHRDEDGTEVDLEGYRLMDAGGEILEIAIGADRLAFVRMDGDLTELFERCPSWRAQPNESAGGAPSAAGASAASS